jgi:hypothetical protein
MAQKIVCDICDDEAPLPAANWAAVTVRPSDTGFALDICPACTLMLKGGDIKGLLRSQFSPVISARKDRA